MNTQIHQEPEVGLTQPIEARVPQSESSKRVATALDRAVDNLRRRQAADGHWPGDYGGPLFLLPGLVITYAITGQSFSQHQKERMIVYLRNVQREDGGWGLHIAGHSTVLGTTLNYVAMRLLGVTADDPDALRAKDWLHAHGGAAGIPTWGKFWLAVMGLYQWEGLNPLSPELWLLPKQLPFHPSHFWCHTRQVFLPMSYLYGRRFQAKETPLTLALRQELFVEPWAEIHWPALREKIAPEDLYTPHSSLFKRVNRWLALYEKRPLRWLRRKALKYTFDHIRYADESTGYLTIGPVSKAIQMLAVWCEDPDSPAFAQHLKKVDDYLWDGHDGLKMQGYNGSQLWDTAFAALAIVDSGRPQREGAYLDVLEAAHGFIDAHQVRDNLPEYERYHRDPIKGAWPFSTAEQAWTVSDCTAESLKAATLLEDMVDEPLSPARLQDAVDHLLGSQNRDGGWSEYERERGLPWLEKLNAAEVFGDIMIGYSYTECTSACIQSLKTFRASHPGYRSAEITQATSAGLRFLRKQQRPDGSWYGGWGVCFTYGTWFGIDGLLAGGEAQDHERIKRACQFLLDHQRDDGGWSESYRACEEKQWVEGDQTQPIQTAWGLLPLLSIREAGILDSDKAIQAQITDAVTRGISFLLKHQNADGSWTQDAISGVFNRNCMIHYDNYCHVMPLWALSRYFRTLS